MAEKSTPPHVLMFPLPLQGPVNSMLKLAELLCLTDLHITFLVTDYIYDRLHRHSNIRTLSSSYPGFQIQTISDGLPEDHPRGNRFLELFDSLAKKTKPLFKDLLTGGSLGSRISCIIADGILGFTCDVAHEVGVPIFYVRTISAACLWVFFRLPKLIEAGELPFRGDDLDIVLRSVPGMERFLRRRDLPSFCRSGSLNDLNIQIYKTECEENPRAYGLILNTFEELEGPILSRLRLVCSNVYTIGPLHAHLKVKLVAKGASPHACSNSLWQEDWTCITWLDAQPLKSVIYVSFGSLASMTDDQIMEFWHGLVNSGHRFLWVIRPGSVADKNWESELPVEISEGTKERGYVVGWAPQEEVLAHPAVGGFLTHSGWNSTLESIYEGVPMICWPFFLDQQVNSRLVEVAWKLGFDMKDTCDRNVIERRVRDLMEARKEEFLVPAEWMAKSAKMCISEGGSSYCNLERLVNDIKSMMTEHSDHNLGSVRVNDGNDC